MKFRHKFYLIFWIPIPFVLLSGILIDFKLDIHFHDTYTVIGYDFFAILIICFLLISGLGYFICRNRGVKKSLLHGHLYCTLIGGIILASTFLYRFFGLIKYSKDFIEYENIEKKIALLLLSTAGVLLILIGFIIYLINIFTSKAKR